MTADGDRPAGVRQRLFWMAGLRLDPNFSDPDIYMLLTDAPPYAPLMLLRTINVVLDALTAAQVKLPPMYRACLHELADELTFSKDLDVLSQNNALDRDESIEALQWSLGAIMSKSMFFPKPGMTLGEG